MGENNHNDSDSAQAVQFLNMAAKYLRELPSFWGINRRRRHYLLSPDGCDLRELFDVPEATFLPVTRPSQLPINQLWDQDMLLLVTAGVSNEVLGQPQGRSSAGGR